MDGVKLVVQGDDFGMCHAVNEGIVRAFKDGILTQTSTMVACPWFLEAAALGAEHSIPLGIHQTLTCDWDHYRWRPITNGPSLVRDDGTFWHLVPDARAKVTTDDAIVELAAQVERFLAAGLSLTYLDVHMGAINTDAYAEISKRYGVPFLYPGVPTSLEFTSIRGLSDRPAPDKVPYLLHLFETLAPGVHLLVTHPAVASEELRSMTKPDSPIAAWAEEYRVSDLAALTDPAVRDAADKHGIELTTVRDAWR